MSKAARQLLSLVTTDALRGPSKFSWEAAISVQVPASNAKEAITMRNLTHVVQGHELENLARPFT